ncbi:very short patch repair endonuclease [Mycobacterium nebraskense]|uniref:very short patch repair endonuclease n=1 Tax=Mycobacterium nebraskense TaxID=244292 RepID=UPI0009E3DD36|nr:very short patch repair endonuclease [Mycobacterium nebraskense]MBI2696046.1 very short patch repair endonuclease [Mycobacterium nebraskense]MCV7116467.1 very short patch repair endonuclease [Mycobacterium nebraskense]
MSAGWSNTSAAARKVMQGNRSRDTKPELVLRSILHRRGLRYRVAACPVPGVRRTADLLFTRARLAVFIDGCFWHRCPAHYRQPSTNQEYWVAKVDRNVRRDSEVDAMLLEAGWAVVRVWEHDDPEAAADRIEHHLQLRAKWLLTTAVRRGRL